MSVPSLKKIFNTANVFLVFEYLKHFDESFVRLEETEVRINKNMIY